MERYILTAIIILSVVLCGCDSSDFSVLEPETAEVGAEQTLAAGLQGFLDEAKARNVHIDPHNIERLDLVSRNMPPGILGSCRETKEGRLEVVISEDLHDEDLEWVLFHELGHCLLGMIHRDENPSVMNAYDVVKNLAGMSRKDILDEFFQAEFFYGG